MRIVLSDLTLAEQPLELVTRLVDFGCVGRYVGRGARLVVVAEIGASLVAYLLCGRFAAVFRDPRIVVDAHATDMQLRAALRAFIEPAQRQGELRECRAALPAHQIVSHECEGYRLQRARVSR